MTNEQFIDQLTEGTTNLLIETGEKLYAALKDQNYELASKLRDTNQQIVSEAAKAFANHHSRLSETEFKKHFEKQVKFIMDSLTEEFGNVI